MLWDVHCVEFHQKDLVNSSDWTAGGICFGLSALWIEFTFRTGALAGPEGRMKRQLPKNKERAVGFQHQREQVQLEVGRTAKSHAEPILKTIPLLKPKLCAGFKVGAFQDNPVGLGSKDGRYQMEEVASFIIRNMEELPCYFFLYFKHGFSHMLCGEISSKGCSVFDPEHGEFYILTKNRGNIDCLHLGLNLLLDDIMSAYSSTGSYFLGAGAVLVHPKED
jgi:hypothetical protein